MLARARAVLAGGLVLGVGAAATLATWTDQELASAPVSAGTFSLVSRTQTADAFVSHGGGAEGSATLQFAAAGLYPGQSRAAWIQVKASGSLGGSVSLSAVSAPASPGTNSAALRDALTVRVSASVAAGDAVPSCTIASPGTDVALSSLPAVAAQQIAGGGASTATFCIVLTLPADAPSSAQGGSVTPMWTFTGTTG